MAYSTALVLPIVLSAVLSASACADQSSREARIDVVGMSAVEIVSRTKEAVTKMTDKYMTTHTSWDTLQSVPLIVDPGAMPEIYVDHMWGIWIESIIADDVGIPKEENDIDLEDVNFNKISTAGAPFIYLIPMGDFVIAETFDDEDFKLVKYTIPRTAKIITIEYRPRWSPEEVGPRHVLQSVLRE